MAEKKSKIVLMREGIDIPDFAAGTVKSAEVVDALSVMATDFMPQDNTVQSNPEGGFYVANYSDSEAKKLADSPEVEAVVDDIDVYALQDEPPPVAEPESSFDDEPEDSGLMKPDPEDLEALEADPFPELGPDDEQISPEQLNLLTQMEHDIDPELNLEYQLEEGVTGIGAAAGVDPRKLRDLVKCLLKCLCTCKDAGKEVTEEDIQSAIRAVGAEGTDEASIAADLILCNLWIIRAPWAWRYTMGAGVRVAIVDTGIDPRHRDLRVFGGASFVPGVSSWRDDHSHGTHCAGIVAALRNGRGVVGVAPQARLYAVKVLNRAGSGKLSWILNGLIWCYRARMHVVNMSLGSPARSHTERCNPAYEWAGRILRRRGILIVAAAGNDYHKPVGHPARCHSYMAVSAVDCRYRLTAFSSIGPQVEICAPGYRVLSTVPGGYGVKSGTSMSAPHVTGVAALVKARHPAWHGDTIRVHLWRTAIDLGTPGRDWAFGYGLVNAWRAVR